MRDAAVWVEIQQEFIATGVKYPELAAKFGVPLSTIKKKAAEFKWQEKRRAAVEASGRQTGQKKRTKSQSSQFFFSPNSFQPTGRFSALTRLL